MASVITSYGRRYLHAWAVANALVAIVEPGRGVPDDQSEPRPDSTTHHDDGPTDATHERD